jgi:hypothetical protein
MTGRPRDLGGRWPVIDSGVARDHRCLLLFFHLLHALYQVPWKSCCSLTEDDPDYDAEKKRIERGFTGRTKLGWDQIDCYLNKLPEHCRERVTATAFYLFKEWCEGSRPTRSAGAKDDARRELEAAVAATAGRDWHRDPPLLAIPITATQVTTITPIRAAPMATADPQVATRDATRVATGEGIPATACAVPDARTDLEDVERQLAAALEQARHSSERAQAADLLLDQAGRVRVDLRARLIQSEAQRLQAEQDRDAALAAAAEADEHARAARTLAEEAGERERQTASRLAEVASLLVHAEQQAVDAEQHREHWRRREAHLTDRIAFLEEQAAVHTSTSTPAPATPSDDAGMPTGRASARRRRLWISRRTQASAPRDGEEDYRRRVLQQASLTARLEETDRLRRDLVDTVAREFRGPLDAIRVVLTEASGTDAAGGALADRLSAAIENTRRLDRLVESMVTATTAAHTDINSSDLTAALTDVQTVLRTTHLGHHAVVQAEADLSVRMDGVTLRRLLGELLDIVLRSTPVETPVYIGAGRIDAEIILRIRTPARVFAGEVEDSMPAAPSTAGIRYVVEKVVRAHGGRLRTDIAYNDGVHDILEVVLPTAGPPATRRPGRSAVGQDVRDAVAGPAPAAARS